MPVYRTARITTSNFFGKLTGFLELMAKEGSLELLDLEKMSNSIESDRDHDFYCNRMFLRDGSPLVAVSLTMFRTRTCEGYVAAASYSGAGLGDVKAAALQGLADLAEKEEVKEPEYQEPTWTMIMRVPGQKPSQWSGTPFDIDKIEEAFKTISSTIVARAKALASPTVTA